MHTTLNGRVRRAFTPSKSQLVVRSVATLSAAALVIGAGSAVAAPAPSPTVTTPTNLASADIILGASGGDEVRKLSNAIGQPLADHKFGQLNGSVPTGRLINMATNVSWSTVASANSGSSTYSNIVRWADTLKSRSGGPFMVAFSHEPMGSSSDNLGNATQFIAAWRRVHDIFQSRGVTNVQYTWNVTGNSFRVPPSDEKYAGKWYPGDAYVDNVATAAYNWYNCGEGKGKWLSLGEQASAGLNFAKSHGKQLVLAEWASQQDSRRAQWLRDAHAWLSNNKANIRGAFYYQSPTPRAGCTWKLTSSADLDAFGDMARDPNFSA